MLEIKELLVNLGIKRFSSLLNKNRKEAVVC